MFLCRPIISRAIPKYPYWKATPKLQNVCNVVTASKRSLILSGGSWGRDINSQTVQTAHSSTLSASQAVLSSNAPKAEVKRADTGLPPLSVNTYFSLRQLDRSLVAAQPKCNYLHLLDLLNAPGAEELVDAIVLDILELFGGTEEERFELLQDALSKHQLKLSSRNLQVICQYIGEHPQFELSERAMHGLLRVLNREKIWTLQHINGFECIKPALLNMVSRNSVPGGVQSISYSPPTIIFAAFVLLRRLIRGQHRAAALELFQSLATAKLIPSEAMAGLDNISQSFNAILRVALIRACLRWQWHSLASIFLLDGLASSHSRSGPLPIFLDLNAEVFYELLNTPTHRDIRACERLIRHVHPFSPAPNSIIRLFYNRAHENDLIETAQSLYEFTRLSLSATSHPYPPPSGAALGWLMEHFAFRSKIPHLAKVLANEVAENNIPLIPPVRASFITCCAARSHSTIARKLWERYSLGKDKDQVLGNSRLMIRMVSLFTAVSKKASDSVEWGSQERELLTPQERLDIVNTSRSAHNFAIQVLKSFKNCHLPLSGASHTALTSYARGCFIVGRYAQGLAALGHLLRRKELPDLHDINVVLSAAAHSQPELGAQIVQRMEKRSIRPDAVTYTTIMQGAFLNGKRELITDMLHKLNSLPDARMSLKTLTNIIRITTHRFPEDSDEAMQTKLAQAHNLIIKHPEANIASSLQTGKYLIRRCIQADSPIFAFKFWQLWLQKGQQWDDIEHRYLRLLVARTIREHRDNLNPTLVSSALSQLIRRRGRTPPP